MSTTSWSHSLRRTIQRGGVLAFATFAMAGCFGDDNEPSGPNPANDEPPVLPSAEKLDFNLRFFEDSNAEAERSSKRNFYNAYVRAVTVGAITHVVLTPPIYAFSLAIHSVPSLQDDGSYIWVYTYVDGAEEAQIRLRGLPIDEGRVQWQLRVTNEHDSPPLNNALWFEGETWKDGAEGMWSFHDPEVTGGPVVATIEWGQDGNGEFLRLTDLVENVGDELELRSEGSENRITYVDADMPANEWFIRWIETTGAGSLKVPDYNSGNEACWDEDQNDVVCAAS